MRQARGMYKQCSFSLFSCYYRQEAESATDKAQKNQHQILLNFSDQPQQNASKKYQQIIISSRVHKNKDRGYKSTMESTKNIFSKMSEQSSDKFNSDYKNKAKISTYWCEKSHHKQQNTRISLKNKHSRQRQPSSLHYIVSEINKSWESNQSQKFADSYKENQLFYDNMITYVAVKDLIDPQTKTEKKQGQTKDTFVNTKKQVGIQYQQFMHQKSDSAYLRDITFSKNKSRNHNILVSTDKNAKMSGNLYSYSSNSRNNSNKCTQQKDSESLVLPIDKFSFRKQASNQKIRQTPVFQSKTQQKTTPQVFSTGLYSNQDVSSFIRKPTTSIIIKPVPGRRPSNIEEQPNMFKTLAQISKKAESVRDDNTSQEHVSLIMSHEDIIHSDLQQSEGDDGSKIYRTIKRLTSKGIDNNNINIW